MFTQFSAFFSIGQQVALVLVRSSSGIAGAGLVGDFITLESSLALNRRRGN